MGASHLTSLVLDDVMSIVRGDAPAVVTCTTNMTKTAPAVVVRCDAPSLAPPKIELSIAKLEVGAGLYMLMTVTCIDS